MAMNLTAPKVRRGRLTNYRTGMFLSFVYNPSRIHEKKGVNLVVDDIPGVSDPLVRFASGKVSTIDFTLDIDGEGRLRRSGAQLFNGAVAEFPIQESVKHPTGQFLRLLDRNIREGDNFSIAGEIEFLESFQFVTDPEIAPGKLAEPDQVVFTYGRRYQGVLCAVSDVNIDIFEMDTDLSPTKAQVKITLLRMYDKPRFATDVWDVAADTDIPQQRQRAISTYRRGSGGTFE